MPAPAGIIDSLLIATQNDDFELFRRQYLSDREVTEVGGYFNLPPSKDRDERIKAFVKKHQAKVAKRFGQLKTVVKKYKLTVKDMIANSFKYESYYQTGFKRRKQGTRNVNFKFVKGATLVHLQLSPMLLRGGQWKINPVWDFKLYTDELDKQYKKSDYFVRTFPQEPLAYAQQIYQKIKNKDLEGLMKAYPTNADLKGALGYSKDNYRGAVKFVEENKRNLERNFDKLFVVDSLILNKTYILWNKRKFLYEPNFGIRLYVHTKGGIKKLYLRGIITDQRIFLVDISTVLNN